MIQNITQGSNFAGAIKYVHGKDGAERIGGNMSGETPRQLDREWGVYREMNSVVREDVFHASLSLPEGERMSVEQWQDAAQTYVEKMGFEKSAWVAYRHTDTNHDHIHILASRIDYDGRAVDMWQSYKRGEEICRQLEKEHGLTRVAPSHEADLRAPKRAEFEMYQRTGEVSVKIDLQGRVEAAARRSETWSQYADELGKEGVGVAISRRENGQPYGISYIRESDGETMKGSDLGRAYAWSGLQKRAGVSYEHGRDDEAIGRAEARGREARERSGVERESGGIDRGGASVEGGQHRSGREGDGAREPDERADRGDIQRANASPGQATGGGEPVRGDDENGRADASGRKPEGGASNQEHQRDASVGGSDARRIVRRDSEQGPDGTGGRELAGDASSDHGDNAGSTRRVIARGQQAGDQGGRNRGVDFASDNGDGRSGRDLVSEPPRDSGQGSERRPASESETRAGTRDTLQRLDGRGAGDMEKTPNREARAGKSSDSPSIKEQISAEIQAELDKHRTPEQLKERAEFREDRHREFDREQASREEERTAKAQAERNERYQFSDDTRREIWKENQIAERIGQGQDLEQRGRMRGEVVAVEQFGNKSAAVIDDGKGRFAVVDVDEKNAAELQPGKRVSLTQESGKAAQIKVETPTVAKEKGGHER